MNSEYDWSTVTAHSPFTTIDCTHITGWAVDRQWIHSGWAVMNDSKGRVTLPKPPLDESWIGQWIDLSYSLSDSLSYPLSHSLPYSLPYSLSIHFLFTFYSLSIHCLLTVLSVGQSEQSVCDSEWGVERVDEATCVCLKGGKEVESQYGVD
jgi:hypothetical protein